MQTHKIAFATILTSTAIGLLGMAAAAQAQAFRQAAHDQDFGPKRAPDLIILAQAPLTNNDVAESLNNAASLFENIAMLAINGESDPVANDLRIIIAAINNLKGRIPDQTYRDIADRLSDMSDAQKHRDFEGIALAAIEDYRTTRLAQSPAVLPVPINVYMLKYTGYKMMALARNGSPDWQRLADTTDETSNYWAEISPKIKQKALRTLMDTIIMAIKNAMAQQNVAYLQFITKLQLNAVDLLKSDFIKK